MKFTALVLALLLAATGAYAQFNGCPPGFCPVQGGGGGGVAPPACTIDGNLNFATKQCNMIFYMTGVIR